eukprot:2984857-Pleurochrysis_carterae.AAC.1
MPDLKPFVRVDALAHACRKKPSLHESSQMQQQRQGLAQQPRRSMLMTVGAASDLRRGTGNG